MKSLYIKNYKNLRELSIDSLARVNLIVGCNNVGKSTLLEAVSIYLANGNDEWLKTILDFRGEMVNVDSAKGDVDFSQVLSEHYSSLFSGRKMDFRNATAISIGEQSDLLNIKLVHIAEEQRGGTIVRWVYNDDDADSGEHLFRYIGDGLSVVSGSNAPMLIPFFRRGFPGNVKDRVPFEYVLAQDFHLRKNVLLFDRISLSDREGYVLDVMMPVMDGIEFCKAVKGNFDTSHIPLILLTAKSKEEDRVEAYESGADAFIAKPFNLSILHARIGNLLKSRERVMKDFKKQLVFEAKELNYTSIDEDFLQRAIDCVNRHLDDPNFDQTRFLEEMQTTKSTFFRKLKSLTGLTYVSFIRNIRMKAACRIMEEKKHIRISELAYAVGYNDPRYFSSSFKKEIGMQPSEYMERFTSG